MLFLEQSKQQDMSFAFVSKHFNQTYGKLALYFYDCFLHFKLPCRLVEDHAEVKDDDVLVTFHDYFWLVLRKGI